MSNLLGAVTRPSSSDQTNQVETIIALNGVRDFPSLSGRHELILCAREGFLFKPYSVLISAGIRHHGEIGAWPHGCHEYRKIPSQTNTTVVEGKTWGRALNRVMTLNPLHGNAMPGRVPQCKTSILNDILDDDSPLSN